MVEQIDQYPDIMFIGGSSYSRIKMLGTGAFGAVLLYQNKYTSEFIAIKFEMPGAIDQSLLSESLLLKSLKDKGLKRIP